MKIQRLIVLLSVFIIIPLCSEEIQRNDGKDESGVKVTIVEYKNEPDGKVKVLVYGTEPCFTDKVIFYDNTNKEYYKRLDLHNIYYDANHPKGQAKDSTVCLRDNPDEKARIDFKFDEPKLTMKTYYASGNTQNRKYRIAVTIMSKKYVSIQEVYEDPKKELQNVSDQITYFNEAGEATLRMINFADNSDYMHDEVIQYDPPVFSQTTKSSKTICINYNKNKNGMMRKEIQYDERGWRVESIFYDPNFTDDRFTDVISFYDDKDNLKRQVRYFEDTLYRGKVYFISQILNDDGSVQSTTYYDRQRQDVERDEL